MNKYLKIVLIPCISIISLTLLFSLLNLMKIDIPRLFYLLSTIIISFVTGIITAQIFKTKSYIKGMIIGLSLTFILSILSLIIEHTFTIYNLLYYLIIILSTTLGAIVSKIKS